MYLLFDIGGSKMRLAISESGESFHAPIIHDTPQNYDEGIELIVKTAKDLVGIENLVAICGGIAGPFDDKKRSLVSSPNLSDWVGKPFKQDLEEKLGAKVYIENDAAMVGLGEAVAGAGRGSKIMAYLTVSTGVGGVRIVNKKIDLKDIGFEPGHQIINYGGEIKELEKLVSGTALAKERGKAPKDIPQNDPVWDMLARTVAYGLYNVVMFWSPDTIVLGGSMIVGDPAIPLEPIRKRLAELLTIFPEVPEIKKAELDSIGGLHGALAYIKQIQVTK